MVIQGGIVILLSPFLVVVIFEKIIYAIYCIRSNNKFYSRLCCENSVISELFKYTIGIIG